MKKIIITILGIAIITVVGFVTIQKTLSRDDSALSEEEHIVATIYKSPTCGCCGVYASYMKKEGYDVETKNVGDLSAIKRELGVPNDLESCHTMEVEGYVVEGHIPEEAVQKLLMEKPDIKGIGMAGMPAGSPGMPGPKTEDFVIYEINHDGTTGPVFVTI